MKRILTGIIAALLMICLAVPAFAETKRVWDNAGIFSTTDLAALEEKAADATEETGMEVVILTSNHKDGKSTEAYADDFYDANGFGTGEDRSGILVFIDMEDRLVYLSTTGKAVQYFTDERIDQLTNGNDEMYDYLADQDYRGAMECEIRQIVKYYHQGIPADQHSVVGEPDARKSSKVHRLNLLEILISVLIPGITAGITVGNIKKQYAMQEERKKGSNARYAYRAASAFAFAGMADQLISHNITRRPIPRVSVSSGGHSSSGQSTIHMGSSGTFHGGGGSRHF